MATLEFEDELFDCSDEDFSTIKITCMICGKVSKEDIICGLAEPVCAECEEKLNKE